MEEEVSETGTGLIVGREGNEVHKPRRHARDAVRVTRPNHRCHVPAQGRQCGGSTNAKIVLAMNPMMLVCMCKRYICYNGCLYR